MKIDFNQNLKPKTFDAYCQILELELLPALGCTEPIAVAYAAAVARNLLPAFPDDICVYCSGNVIKNVKSVVVPGTGNLKGIAPSAILGALAGDANLKMQVLQTVNEGHVQQTKELLAAGFCRVELLENVPNLDIIVEMKYQDHSSLVQISDMHTRIVRMEKDGQSLAITDQEEGIAAKDDQLYAALNLRDIYRFATTIDLDTALKLMQHQVKMNSAIAEEGLANTYGANIGASLLKYYGDDIKILARALPAAGSDARMSGCVLPVVTNSGSGNQGMTACLPVLAYARHLKASEHKTYQALALSNLIAIYLKLGLGRLSAFCGAVSAACGSGAGITFLYDGDFNTICHTIINTLANVAGIVCDGAKPSCAAKIASAVDAAILGDVLSRDSKTFLPGEGLVMEDAEATIESICRMGREGMKATDVEILNIMLGK